VGQVAKTIGARPGPPQTAFLTFDVPFSE
jgi:hypothetical protein